MKDHSVREAPVEWKCIIGNLKKWKEGIIDLVNFLIEGKIIDYHAEKVKPGRRSMEDSFQLGTRRYQLWGGN